MKTTITIATAPVALPASITFGGVKVSLTDGSGNVVVTQTLDAAPYSASFDVQPATYVVTAVALDTNGGAIGQPFSEPVTLSADAPQTYDLPQGVTITTS